LDNANFTLLTTTSPYTTAECVYFDDNLNEDTPYYYIVRTKRGVSLSGYTNSAYDYTYPKVPTLLSVIDACLASNGTITVKGTHNTGAFRWYNELTTPTAEGFKNPNGVFFEAATYVTPNLQTARSYYVSARGNKYESQGRLMVSVAIRPLPLAKLTVADKVKSCASTFNLTAEVIAGATYSWYNNGILLGTTTVANFTATTTGFYHVVVGVNGCSAASTMAEIKLNFKPEVKILNGAAVSFCQSGVLSAKVIAGATYEWSNGGSIVGTSENVTVTNSGTYTLTVTQDGCPASKTIEVNVTSFPSISISASETELCPGKTTELTATAVAGAIRYEWLRNGRVERVTSANTVKTNRVGEYKVMVYKTDVCAAMSSTSVTIETIDVPKATLILDGNVFRIETTGSVATVKWYLNGEEQTSLADKTNITAVKTGRYVAMITYTTGCEVSSNSDYFVLGTKDDENTAAEKGFQFYPNPTKGDVFVKMNGRNNGQIDVMDNLGRTLQTVKFEGESEVKVNVGNLPTGTYIVKITTNEFSIARKLVKE
jgi:hypothetical protein